ncbi:MAG: cytochrome c [Vicinamibacterales bacterium]
MTGWLPLPAALLLAVGLSAGAAAQNQSGPTSTPAKPPAATAPSGDAAIGRKLYTSFGCYQCHGYEGQGSSATGPRLGPRPMPFAAFVYYVRQPTGQMPPYTVKVVSEADLTHIYAFLASRPAPVAVESTPLLR